MILNHRGNEINLRTNLLRIIKAAGCEQWPKLFVNLRSSCRTELEERFPSHVIDGWLGHSTAVAKKHYLQTTDDYWEKAAEMPFNKEVTETNGAVAGAVISANQDESRGTTEHEKPNKSHAMAHSDTLRNEAEYPRQGSNLWPKL